MLALDTAKDKRQTTDHKRTRWFRCYGEKTEGLPPRIGDHAQILRSRRVMAVDLP